MVSHIGIAEARFLLGCVATSCLCDFEHKTVYFLMIPFSTKKKDCAFYICVLKVLSYTCMEGNCKCSDTIFNIALK